MTGVDSHTTLLAISLALLFGGLIAREMPGSVAVSGHLSVITGLVLGLATLGNEKWGQLGAVVGVSLPILTIGSALSVLIGFDKVKSRRQLKILAIEFPKASDEDLQHLSASIYLGRVVDDFTWDGQNIVLKAQLAQRNENVQN